MFGLGMPELIIILIIAVLIFGASRLPEVGSSLGRAIRGFKEASEKRESDETKSDATGEAPKICPQCGRELSAEGVFCPACGKRLSEKS